MKASEIVLSKKQERELMGIIKKEKNDKQRRRYETILLKAKNLSHKEIEDLTGADSIIQMDKKI